MNQRDYNGEWDSTVDNMNRVLYAERVKWMRERARSDAKFYGWTYAIVLALALLVCAFTTQPAWVVPVMVGIYGTGIVFSIIQYRRNRD